MIHLKDVHAVVGFSFSGISNPFCCPGLLFSCFSCSIGSKRPGCKSFRGFNRAVTRRVRRPCSRTHLSPTACLPNSPFKWYSALHDVPGGKAENHQNPCGGEQSSALAANRLVSSTCWPGGGKFRRMLGERDTKSH